MFNVKPKHSYLDLFEGLVIGGTLAAAATFLFGTKKGKAIQKDLVRQYKKAGRVTHEMKQKFDHAINTGISKGKRKVAKAKRVVGRVKTKAKRITRKAKRITTKAKALKREVERKAA